jgi:hypothetical protein
MGHDFIEYEGRFEHFNDMDIWVLRHFLIEEARSMCLSSQDDEAIRHLCQYFEDWDWLGPGDWLGLDLSESVSGQEKRRALLEDVLNRAARRIEGFGDAIPLEYLKSHVDTPVAYQTDAEPTDRLVPPIRRISRMLLVGDQRAGEAMGMHREE